LAGSLRRAHEDDIKEAIIYMANKAHHGHNDSEDEDDEAWVIWGIEEVNQYIRSKPGTCVVLIHGFILDVTGYLGVHVGLYITVIQRY
jgi:stearoyl-CoA desaturase (Delta-9 desaturase)